MRNNQAVNTLRTLAADAVQAANSGHPGLPLGAAPIVYTLWQEHMNHNPHNPKWPNRDRFILSAGHGSALLYAALHLFDYGLTTEDLKNFRQENSLTPGHPEYAHTKGVEMTTGPLGQGVASAVGFAMAEAHMAAHFNRPNFPVVDHYTYALVGDGCLMEGISYEALSLAGTLKLDKLIVLYDSNNITIEGSTSLAFTENVRARMEAQGFYTQLVEDGNNTAAISLAIAQAKATKDKPSFIEIKTQIGYGCAQKVGKASAHGEPLGKDNITQMKIDLGLPVQDFYVSDELRKDMDAFCQTAYEKESNWNWNFEAYKAEYPELAKEWDDWHNPTPYSLEDLYANYSNPSKSLATRQASYEVINELAKRVPNFIGGSADLAPSTKTYMAGKGDFSAEDYTGHNLHFGIREHAMAAIANGMALYGGLKVFCSTFFVFSDYLKNAMRLSALMHLPVTYVLTHDSIGVGEDGPTHQPIEHLAMLRSMPNMITFRPADAKETIAAWEYAMNSQDAPVSIVLSRQNLPYLANSGEEAKKGAYVIGSYTADEADILLMATGSEVQLIEKAATLLDEAHIKACVISMPSMDLFEQQPLSYKQSILPTSNRKRLAVEALTSFGWDRYTGLDGRIISLDTFGESAPANLIFKKHGFCVENIVEQVKAYLQA